MESNKPRTVTFFLWAIIAITSILAMVYVAFIIRWGLTYPAVPKIVEKNFAAILGLPISAIASFALVSLLKIGCEPIEFKGLGFEFKGASGPVVLWIFCFLAMVTGIKILL